MNSRNHIVKVNAPKSARLLEKKMSSRFGSFHDSNVSLTNVEASSGGHTIDAQLKFSTKPEEEYAP